MENELEEIMVVLMLINDDDSGARGSKDQIKQLAGMRGLMAKPQKSMKGGW